MGKAYAKELSTLGDTYGWATAAVMRPLEEFVADAQGWPLVAIGSGGSATAAHLAALLHRFHARRFARHTTPLEVLLSEPNLREAAVLLLSASGKNRDVLAAMQCCLQQDSRAIATVCTQRGSPLASMILGRERAHVLECALASGKDGFLATNSLLATCVFIARAYGVTLPTQLTFAGASDLTGLSGRQSVVVLHGGWGSPVATDLESKLNESAIAGTQVCDYRNFGHGRHLWLARRALDTFVVALVTPETSALADKTVALLPREIPIVEIRTSQEGSAGTIDLLAQSFHLVGRLGELQGFDPGRPTVPEFGRKLYHLPPPLPAHERDAPVARKVASALVPHQDQHRKTITALRAFVESLYGRDLGGVILDYDGTLCTGAERFGPLRAELGNECRRLLEAGLIIGIATGRGRSVRESLQQGLPRALWDRVVVGYYNGGEIADLTNDSAPVRDPNPAPPLDAARALLERDPQLQELATVTPRLRQITIEPKQHLSTATLMSYVMTVVAPLEHSGVRVLASSHSVDVLPPGVSKLAVVEEVKKRVRNGCEVLCVGDRGLWPGNDCALLAHEPSLSVDEVSASLTTCWNIAPSGMTGPDATLLYLRAIYVENGRAALDGRDLWRRT
jgi:hydroxymethylpyrimidine pyrophosphatase-like HAD family hydrolase